MSTFIQYINDAVNPLTAESFNDVDSLVLTQLIYLNLNGLVPSSVQSITMEDCADRYFVKHGTIPDMLKAFGDSLRFKDWQLSDYEHVFDNENATQYASIAIHLPDGSVYVTYIGADDTLVGWQDAFRTSYEVSPGENRALDYLHRIAMEYPDAPLYVGGHSKGGLLAVYAAVMQSFEVRIRIRRIYNFDGPGLSPTAFQAERYDSIRTRLICYRPQYAVVGFLYDRKEPFKIVCSTARRFLQHDPNSWIIEGDHFKTAEKLDPESVYVSEVFRRWINSTTEAQRRSFVQDFFRSLGAGGADRFSKLHEHRFHQSLQFLGSILKTDRSTKEAILKFEGSTVTALPKYDKKALAKKTAPYVTAAVLITVFINVLQSSRSPKHSS
ncbi:MAG: DUF2974 domain-containing protein [Solobacterium sp.]|jgi:hypothetical protein|nr:DUF2974 domain-containing protein [Solobacterium sp.]MCH4222347.1 DUF2974 domain-containing protein [Solobacterium sp.]MCH4265512.1 DUF2974 domain-containing protein [Solobacterium sp.]